MLFEICSGQKLSMKINKEQLLQQYDGQLWYLCTALLLNEIYQPMRFQDDTWNTFRVMLGTKIKYENQQRAITP